MKSEMTHIDEGTLQAYLDGELLLEERWRAERHLEECELCRMEVDAMTGRARRFTEAMSLLDAAPRERQHAIGWPRQQRAAFLRRMLPRAAVLLLFAGAAASATVPGWPLRQWIESIAEEPREVAVTSPEEETQAPRGSAAEAMESGVFVDAVNGRVEVEVLGGHDLRVRAVLVEGTRAGVAATGSATESRFRTGTGRIEVHGPHDGELRVEIPRGAAVASVIINGQVVLQKEGSSLDLSTDLTGLQSAGIGLSIEQ